MVFSSIFFIFVFLPVALAIYHVVPYAVKNAILLVFSLIFYAWGEPVYVVLMVFSILINYVSAQEISALQRAGKQGASRAGLVFAIVVNLGILAFYKYFGFFVGILNSILPLTLTAHDLPLPIGISFYTFQALSYVIDVYRGNVNVQRNVITFATYVTMFPQLIAGPIVRYADIEKQLENREITLEKFGSGVTWFISGLTKKVLLANNLGFFFDTISASAGSGLTVTTAWVGCFAYTMQIYFDFSGYSDMAIGLGKMLGFDLMKNFDHPYTATSITDFWRRWHMSLSGWFKEYVYIPLGGNRCSKAKNIRNLLIVWTLTGFWHGADWNFIAWGLYYGILLVIEKHAFNGALRNMPRPIGHVYTLFIVMIGWVFFFSPSLGAAGGFLSAMFGFGSTGFVDATALYYLRSIAVVGVISIFASTTLVRSGFERVLRNYPKAQMIFQVAVYALLFILCVAFLVDATYNPFLYFRF